MLKRLSSSLFSSHIKCMIWSELCWWFNRFDLVFPKIDGHRCKLQLWKKKTFHGQVRIIALTINLSALKFTSMGPISYKECNRNLNSLLFFFDD